jgi:hypothetical protein
MIQKDSLVTSGAIFKYSIEDTVNRTFEISGETGSLATFECYNDDTSSDVVVSFPVRNVMQTLTVKAGEAEFRTFVIDKSPVYGTITATTPFRFRMSGM